MSHRHSSRMQEMSGIHSLPRKKRHRRLQEGRRNANEAASRHGKARREEEILRVGDELFLIR